MRPRGALLYRWLARRILPPGFRRRFAADLVGMVIERSRHAHRPRWFWTREVADLAATAVREWARAARRTRAGQGPGRIGTSKGWEVGMWNDVKHAARAMRKAPGFTAVVVLTLALGIGANTAIFSVVDTVVLRPLPYPEADRLVAVTSFDSQRGRAANSVAYADLLDLRAGVDAFERLAGYETGRWVLSGPARPAKALDMASVTHEFFATLGVEPLLGRTFLPEEHEPERRDAVVLNHDFWRSEFGGDPDVVGTTVLLSARPMTVVGVMPEGFDYPFLMEMAGWVPMAHERFQPDASGSEFAERDWNAAAVFGRLAPDATFEGAEVQVATVGARLAEAFPRTNATLSFRLRPLKDVEIGGVDRPLLLLLAAVGAILLIAIANTASLSLARGTTRHAEAALRTALGAGRARLARLFLTESLLHAALGGALGLVLAYGTLGLLDALGLRAPRLSHVGIDARVLAVTSLATVLTGLLFGLAPALRGSRVDLQSALKDGGRGSGVGRGTQRLQKGLVAVEVALSTTLVAAAGLLAASFFNIVSEDPGFDPDRVLTVRISLPLPYMSDPDDAWKGSNEFFERLRADVAGIPGVDAVALSYTNPLEPNTRFTVRYQIPGVLEAPRAERPVTYLTTVSEGFFETFRIPVLQGRGFDHRDRKESPGAAVINRTMARAAFGDRDPIGHTVEGPDFWGASGYPTRYEIVGVVDDVRAAGLDEEPVPVLYLPFSQAPMGNMRLIARTRGEPDEVAPRVRDAVWELDRAIPMEGLTTMHRLIDESVAAPRLVAWAVGAFAGLALILAVVGVYGILSFMVGLRRSEFGIRQVLGADDDAIQRLVLSQGMAVVAVGVGVGLAGAAVTGRLLESFLYGVRPGDPRTLSIVVTVLLVASILACWVPAVRATRSDPARMLRSE